QLRRLVELESTRKFTEQATTGEIARWLDDHRAIEAEILSQGSNPQLVARAVDLDWRFHLRMIEHLRNPLMMATFERTLDLLNVIRADNPYALPRYAATPSLREHLEILQAMESRDPDEAVRRMEQHLASSMHRAMGL